MKKFHSVCIDSKTNLEILFSECSYNSACSALDGELHKAGDRIERCVALNDHVTTQIFSKSGRVFYYDEDRGLLLNSRN